MNNKTIQTPPRQQLLAAHCISLAANDGPRRRVPRYPLGITVYKTTGVVLNYGVQYVGE